MIIYLHGPDSYLRKKKLEEILQAYTTKYTTHDLLHIYLTEDETGWTRARDFLSQPSMFVESKVLVLHEAVQEENIEARALLLEELTTEKSFVIISDSERPHTTFEFLLKKSRQVHEFSVPTVLGFQKFILAEARARGLVFDASATQYFSDFIYASFPVDEPKKGITYGNERMWHARTELEKLATQSFSQPLSRSILEQSIQFFSQKNFYTLTQLLLRSRDIAVKLTTLEELSSGNFDSGRIFNTLGFFAVGREAFVLAEKDIQIKSGVLDYDSALLSFVLG